MKAMGQCFGLSVAMMLLFVSSPAKADERADKELAKLKGTWVCVATLRDGAEVKSYVGVKAVIEGDSLTWYFPQKDGSYREQRNKFRIGPTKEPKHFDWWRVDDKGESTGRVDPRLYSISGDEFRWATNLDFKTRPKTFDSARWQFTTKRVKDGK